MKKIMNKILVVEPNKEPYTKTVADIETAVINIVGNELAYIPITKHIDIVYNDLGKTNNLQANRVITDDILCGTFVIVANYKDTWVSLKSKQIRKYKKMFKLENNKGIIEFCNMFIKNSRDLIKMNLKGVHKLKSFLVTDKEFKKLYKKIYKRKHK